MGRSHDDDAIIYDENISNYMKYYITEICREEEEEEKEFTLPTT